MMDLFSLVMDLMMALFSHVLWLLGFVFGSLIGLYFGCYFFIDPKPSRVDDFPLWLKYPDFDRVEWLNKFIEYLWPYVEKASRKANLSCLIPIIGEIMQEDIMDTLCIIRFTLGSVPPKIEGMKVYVTDGNELIMESSIKWAGNSNVTFSEITQIVDFQISLLVRITLKPLVSIFPYFANIMEKPNVDFDILCDEDDDNIMDLPGTHFLYAGNLEYYIAEKCLWPKFLKIQMIDMTKALKMVDEAFEETLTQTIPIAPISTPVNGGLLVVIVRAVNGLQGKYNINPRVCFIFRREEEKTKLVMKNTDLRWKEVQFTDNDVLNVEVVEITSSKNPLQQKESLGYVNIHLGDVVSRKSINKKDHLVNSKNGWIQIELQWRTSSESEARCQNSNYVNQRFT